MITYYVVCLSIWINYFTTDSKIQLKAANPLILVTIKSQFKREN